MAFITRLFRSCKLIVLPILLAAALPAAAEGIVATRSEARLSDSGQLSVSSRFRTDLPDQLKQALKQGVPLNFTLSWQLSAPTVAAYKFKFKQLIGGDNSVRYRLSYHPLTNRYRVTVGTFSTEYDSLDTALRAIGAIANWRVWEDSNLSGAATQVRAEIRLQLSTDKLPKPFQINALNAESWQLDSGWKALVLKGN